MLPTDFQFLGKTGLHLLRTRFSQTIGFACFDFRRDISTRAPITGEIATVVIDRNAATANPALFAVVAEPLVAKVPKRQLLPHAI